MHRLSIIQTCFLLVLPPAIGSAQPAPAAMSKPFFTRAVEAFEAGRQLAADVGDQIGFGGHRRREQCCPRVGGGQDWGEASLPAPGACAT